MQLYNTLSAEERAIMIDDSGKQRLTLSFYAYAQIQDPTQFRNDLFLAWNPLEVLGRIYVANEGINNCPFLLIISTLSRTVLKYMLS
jgi:UPF0176 protein